MSTPASKNIRTEDLGNNNFRQTETSGEPAVESRLAYSDATRPAASKFLAGTSIWNTSANCRQWSDGTNWRDSQGNLT